LALRTNQGFFEPLAKVLKSVECRHSGQAERDPESSFLRHPGFPLSGMTEMANFAGASLDGFEKTLKPPAPVIPVETGIQYFQKPGRFWIPACSGMTTFYEFTPVESKIF
jgi:hypothetical protein